MSKRYILVDGNALVHAAWHGYPERLGPDGLSYRALHGFLSKIHRLERDYIWDELLVVFDPVEGSSYRKSLFPDYKSHRPESDPDLKRQLLLVETALIDLGISTLKVPGVESDDVIGTLAKKECRNGSIVMILTPDKDMAQLVDAQIGLLRPVRGEAAIDTPYDYVGESGVFDKFGVTPSQIADWLALMGDVSDNIPGVRGVGPKKATKLIETYGDVRTVLTHADKISGKLGEALRESREAMETVIKLTTIQVELDHAAWNVRHSRWSEESLAYWAQMAGFPSWMGRFHFLDDENVLSEPTDAPEQESPMASLVAGVTIIQEQRPLVEIPTPFDE